MASFTPVAGTTSIAMASSKKDGGVVTGFRTLEAPSLNTSSIYSIGKRSRANSSSSQSSSDSSSVASSVFSRPGLSHYSSGSDLSSALSLTSCSSVSSSPDSASPPYKAYADCASERPSKTLKTRADETACQSTSSIVNFSSNGCNGKIGGSSSSNLATAVEACNLESLEEPAQPVLSQLREPSPSPVAAPGNKTLLVDGLVDATVHVLGCIWFAPTTSSVCKLLRYHGGGVCTCTKEELATNVNGAGSSCKPQTFQQNTPCSMTSGLPLDLFVRETLRRSRTSCSTLQAALLYILRIADKARQARLEDDDASSFICARRIFLAAVLTSSKFLQDRTYSNKAWSRISGLPVADLSHLERSFLQGIDYSLYVGDEEWQSLTTWLRGGIAARTGSRSPVVANGAISRKGLDRTQSDVIAGTSVHQSDPKNIFTLDYQLPEPAVPSSSAVSVAVPQPSHNLVAAAILGSRFSRSASNDSTPTMCASPASMHSNGTPTLEAKRSSDMPLAYPLRRVQPQRSHHNNGSGLRSGRSVSSNAIHSIHL